MSTDDDFFLISYYLEKGHKLSDLINLTTYDKLIMLANIVYQYEMRLNNG